MSRPYLALPGRDKICKSYEGSFAYNKMIFNKINTAA